MDAYVLQDLLGSGPHGAVYRAQVVGRPGRLVAVKRFHAPVSAAQIDQARHQVDALERLAHPHLLRPLEVVTDEHGVAVVTPLLPGGSLATRITRGRLPPATVADLGARLGDALAAAHDAAVVHGDVTAANVLYDAEDQPLLTDVVTAVLAGPMSSEVPGAAISPDLAGAQGGIVPGPVRDQHGLGTLLHHTLTGPPADAAARVDGAPSGDATSDAIERNVDLPLGEVAHDAPPPLIAAIERATSPDPAARFASVRHLADVCEQMRADLTGSSEDIGVALPAAPATTSAEAGPATRLPTGRAISASGDAANLSPRRARRVRTTRRRRATPRRGTSRPTGTSRRTGGRNGGRLARLVAALAAVLIPVAVVLAFARSSDYVGAGSDGATTAGPAPESPRTGSDSSSPEDAAESSSPEDAAESSSPEDAAESSSPGSAPTGRSPPAPSSTEPAPCDDAPPLPADSGEVVRADTEALGCTIDLGWDAEERILSVPTDGAEPVRYRLGEPGDQLVVGDWDCDGRDTPGLYRPVSGEVFTFDGFAGAGGELVSGPPRETGATGGDPVVTTGNDGCDRVEVTPAP